MRLFLATMLTTAFVLTSVAARAEDDAKSTAGDDGIEQLKEKIHQVAGELNKAKRRLKVYLDPEVKELKEKYDAKVREKLAADPEAAKLQTEFDELKAKFDEARRKQRNAAAKKKSGKPKAKKKGGNKE